LGLIARAEDIEALAGSVHDSAGVVLVPAFTGLGAPHWDPDARGLIIGLSRGTTKGHIARAALEAIALQVADLLTMMSVDLPEPLLALRVDGGATGNNLLMQMQADLAGMSLHRAAQRETTAVGAALLAGLGAGVWSSAAALGELQLSDRSFTPAGNPLAMSRLRARWQAAVQRTRGWAALDD
jgi:glycerol kinase